nr:hypothetical protein GCM10020092_097960 [Actinoplanes digitatis]
MRGRLEVGAFQPAWMPQTEPSVNGLSPEQPCGYGVSAGASRRVRADSYEFGQKSVV